MPGEYFGKKQCNENRDHSNERPARKMQLQDSEQINSNPELSAHSSSDNSRPNSQHLYNEPLQYHPNSFYYSNRTHSYLPKYDYEGSRYLCNRRRNGGSYNNIARGTSIDEPDQFEFSLKLGLAVLQSYPLPCSRELQIDFVDRALEYWLRYTEYQNCQRANEAAAGSGPIKNGGGVRGSESGDCVLTREDGGGARYAERSEILCRHVGNSGHLDARRNVPSRGKVQPTTRYIDAAWEHASDGDSSSTLSELESSESSVCGSLENLKLG